jgi:hypothetical protein
MDRTLAALIRASELAHPERRWTCCGLGAADIRPTADEAPLVEAVMAAAMHCRDENGFACPLHLPPAVALVLARSIQDAAVGGVEAARAYLHRAWEVR